MALEKNSVYIAEIEGIGINGEGIARIENTPVFIPCTLPGEKVNVKIVATKKGYAYGKLIDVITPADERAREECPVFGKCGGCQLQHMKYKDQLAFKTVIVQDTLRKVGKINVAVPSCKKSDLKLGYRNKLQLPIGTNKSTNHPLVGFYASNSHRIIDINSCPLHPDWNEKLISIIKKFMTKYMISGYNEESKTGTIRHIVARQIGKQLQITVVINDDTLKNSDDLVAMLEKEFGDPSVFININQEDTNVILGDRYIQLAGEGDLYTLDMDHKVVVSVDSFMQVNHFIKTKLYNKAVEISEVTEDDTVIDAYCGIGILSALFAEHAKHTYGIEIVPSAIENAMFVAKENLLTQKLTFICGDCKIELPKLFDSISGERQGKVVTLIDPPRKGVDREIIDVLLQNLPDKIIYISCNPATLARDLGMLLGTIDLPEYNTQTPKYELSYIQPYDMFPQTKHVETLVCLKRK